MENNYVVLNDASPTKINRPNRIYSILDLTVVSNDLVEIADWRVGKDPGQSDHFPSFCNFSLFNRTEVPNKFIVKRNFKNSDYKDFDALLKVAAEGSIPTYKLHRSERSPPV